jgi:dihydroorotate dehydrogenase electron transfer subunit
MGTIQHQFQVVSNSKLCPRFYRLCLDAPSITTGIKPGQFIHIRAQNGFEPFFRRPFSIYRAKKYLEIFYEVVGPGTGLLAVKKRGDYLDVVGPVGTPFVLPGRQIKHVVMIAGGIGVAPFMILSDVLKKRRDLQLTLLYGGRTQGHVFDMREFVRNGCVVHIATDDGSVGVKGRVSQLFSKIPVDPKSTMIYTCGPNPMMAAVQEFACKHQLSGQAACEEVMACALGACLGCSIKTTNGYKTVCYDGPVFDLQEVVFERPHASSKH